MSLRLTPLSDLKVLSHLIPAYQLTPNTSLQSKPLMIYNSAFPAAVTASQIETHVSTIGVVDPQWRYTMYSRSHFHSTAHEVLVIAHGKAQLCFGHEHNPQRVEAVVAKGDVIVMPAGVAHRLLEDLDGSFEMIGCYPKGSSWDMCYGTEDEAGRIAKISALPWFTCDPIYGDHGPVLTT